MLIFRLNAFSIYMILSHMPVFANRKKSPEDANDGLINESSMPFRRNTGPDEIVMGKNVSIEEFPWQVSLQLQVPGKNLRHLCGGSIIAEKWVLTAEQCNPKYDEEAQKASWWKLMIVAGVTDLYDDSNPNYQKIEHHKWIGHQGYKPKRFKTNDIALIELKDSFRFTEYVKSIATFTGGGMEVGDLSPITQDCVVSGWGDFSGNTLDAVNVKILRPTQCLLETQKARFDSLQIDGKYEQMLSEMKITEEQYFQFLEITFQKAFQQKNIRVETKEEAIQFTALISGFITAMENTLCSWVKRDSVAGVCNGDIGSPIVCKKKGTEDKFVFGVASFFQKLSMEVKPNPCVMNKLAAPVRFTNVGGYAAWIQNRGIIIKSTDSPPPKDGGNTCDLGFYLICCCVIANIIAQVMN